jgi:threonine dehydratase
MSALLEYIHAPTTQSDEAFSIIDSYRSSVDDRTRVDEFEREFPYYAQRLGLEGVLLADLSDNTGGSFKWRGALVGALAQQERGVSHLIAPSAGNHARGAVLAAKALDMRITVAVPSTAPSLKKEGIKKLWDSPQLNVTVAGATFDESLTWALKEHGELLHPYDDMSVIQGQGTVVDDVLAHAPETRHIVTPVGGGGLAAGILLRLRDLGRTDIIVHGAEAEGSNSATRSLARHERTRAERPNMRYGGSAVQTIGKLAFETFQNSSQFHLVKVPDYDVDELSDLYLQGQYDLLRTNTSNFEPTSLVAVAALKQLRDLRGTVTVLGTGQNDSVYPKYSTNSRRLFL